MLQTDDKMLELRRRYFTMKIALAEVFKVRSAIQSHREASVGALPSVLYSRKYSRVEIHLSLFIPI